MSSSTLLPRSLPPPYVLCFLFLVGFFLLPLPPLPEPTFRVPLRIPAIYLYYSTLPEEQPLAKGLVPKAHLPEAHVRFPMLVKYKLVHLPGLPGSPRPHPLVAEYHSQVTMESAAPWTDLPIHPILLTLTETEISFPPTFSLPKITTPVYLPLISSSPTSFPPMVTPIAPTLFAALTLTTVANSFLRLSSSLSSSFSPQMPVVTTSKVELTLLAVFRLSAVVKCWNRVKAGTEGDLFTECIVTDVIIMF